ncbi:MAG: pilus assembly protein [Armatimonadetes bacterium]|nr:pilus assembly protein [Anaerolineae bacterium]
MQHRKSPYQGRAKSRGQTLVEFALTLPILLLVIFSIIEFGRVFQAWVTLQNAARTAARYASTGNVNYGIFIPLPVGPDNIPLDIRVLDAIVPCSENDDGGDDLGNVVPLANGVATYQGSDGLFATWYDGTDCDPTLDDHQQLRKDLLRLFSVMYEARESINSLSVENQAGADHYFEALNAADAKALLYGMWDQPFEREDRSTWFNLQICSSRGFLNPVNDEGLVKFSGGRFYYVRNQADLTSLSLPNDDFPDAYVLPADSSLYPKPFCMLNEIPPAPATGQPDKALRNMGRRWLDAGSAGDRVSILITFNHPLITPVRPPGLNYLTMQARRSIVNESFRAPKAVGPNQRSLPPGNPGTGDPVTPGVPTLPNTATDTPTASLTPSRTPTDTPEPFSCDNITMSWGSPPFSGNNLFAIIQNTNFDQTELLEVKISWVDLLTPYENMYLGAMSMSDDVHWSGPASSNTQIDGPPLQTEVNTGALNQGYRFITAQSSAVWQAVFFNGPNNLDNEMTLYDFTSEFKFSVPGSSEICVIALVGDGGVPPTDPPPPTDGPTPTSTPPCGLATDQISIAFGGFATFGGVWFNLNNNSGRGDINLTGFDFVWPDQDHPAITSGPDYGLEKVRLGGDTLLDNGVQLWRGNGTVTNGNTSLVPPYNNRTVSSAVGTWLSNALIPPGTTKLWLDFDAFGGNVLSASLDTFGARPWHFDSARLRVACGGGGGGGGGGSDDDLEVPIASPTITFTPRATNTRGPTNTAGPPTAVRTATPSRTMAPPTLTLTLPPPTFTPSVTPFGQPTSPGGGGGD